MARLRTSILVVIFLLTSSNIALASGYIQTNLVSDQSGKALITDPSLVNCWGISMLATSPFWVSNAGTNTSTLYGGDVAGSPFTKNALTVTLPGDEPTGTVANGTSDFVITSGSASGPARFIFAETAGNIVGWSPNVPAPGSTTGVIAASHSGSGYTGLAIGNNGVGNFLYAADFANNAIDVYNATFTLTSLAGSFTDPTLPANYGPFNIQNLGGTLYVAYALVGPTGDEVAGPGNGFINKFDTNGNFLGRLVSTGPLNAPWGQVIAPSTFGTFANALLVGNFGDGTINAFNPTTGAFLGTLSTPLAVPIVIEGVWGLTFGNGVNGGDVNTLYFASGPEDETHGLFGKLQFNASAATNTIIATGTNINATQGLPFTGTVATFTDANGPGTYSVTINWGDATSSPGTVTPNGSGGFTVSGTHTYTVVTPPGGVPFSVVIADTSDGGAATANGTATVTATVPTLDFRTLLALAAVLGLVGLLALRRL
jgi:uncharacterized protein (TIGR03118 family)